MFKLIKGLFFWAIVIAVVFYLLKDSTLFKGQSIEKVVTNKALDMASKKVNEYLKKYGPPDTYTHKVGSMTYDHIYQDAKEWHQYRYGQCGKYLYTLGSSGCGPTIITILLRAFGHKKMLPTQVADKIVKMGLRQCGKGTTPNAIIKVMGSYGYGFRATRSFKTALSWASQGYPVVVRVNGKKNRRPNRRTTSYWTHRGHYILWVNNKMSRNKQLAYILNPYSAYEYRQKNAGKSFFQRMTSVATNRGNHLKGIREGWQPRWRVARDGYEFYTFFRTRTSGKKHSTTKKTITNYIQRKATAVRRNWRW